MEKKEIYRGVERLLDEWDPIGILRKVKHINYNEDAIGEYSKYIAPILEVYITKGSIYDYLIKLQTELWDYPNESMKEEIYLISERIVKFLSESKIGDSAGN